MPARRGWAACLGVTVLAASPLAGIEAADIYVHPSRGSDAHAGDRERPLQSLQACVDAVAKPGDRCLLQSAVYPLGRGPVRVDNKAGNRSARVAIAAAGDGPVVLDGTVAVSALAHGAAAGWRAAPEVGPHVYALSLAPGAEVAQLFSGFASAGDTLQMLVPARWPNAGWTDKTMFEGPEHWAHAGPPFGGAEHNVTTGVGKLLDAGACQSNQACCSECNNNSLAASGIDATGAVVILGLYPIVTFQYSSTTLYQVSYHIR
jgi:hypothetical protein